MDIGRLLAAMRDDVGLSLLTHELRSAIAEYAIVEHRLAKLLNSRSIVGSIGETYIAVALDGRLAPNSKAGYDVTLPDGVRVQVKTRMSDASGGGEFGGLTAKSVEEGLFDVAAFVRLDKDLLPTGALSLPRRAIPDVARRRGGKLVCFWSDLLRHPEGTDVLVAVTDAALGLRPDQEPDWDRLDGSSQLIPRAVGFDELLEQFPTRGT